MDISAVLSAVQRTWRVVVHATSADNESLSSRVLRVAFIVMSYGFFYTRSAGTLLNAMAFLVDHHWYVLGVTCAVVVLAISGAILASYEWMWRWQSWIFLSPLQQRVVTVDEDDDAAWQVWAKKLGRGALILLLWSLYCWINVKLDYYVFWTQYSVAHPDFNLELFFVNCLQAGPILIGSAYTLYYLYPQFYTWHRQQTMDLSSSAAGRVDDTHMQSLLA